MLQSNHILWHGILTRRRHRHHLGHVLGGLCCTIGGSEGAKAVTRPFSPHLSRALCRDVIPVLTLRPSGEHVKSGYRRRWGPRRAGGTRHEQTGVPSHAKHQSPQSKGNGRGARIEAKRSTKSVCLSRGGHARFSARESRETNGDEGQARFSAREHALSGGNSAAAST